MWKLLTGFVLLGCFERYVSYTAIPKSVLVFVQNGLVPDVLVTPPATLLHVSFPSGAVADGGNEIPLDQVLQQPKLTWDAELGRFYTVIFLDPDVSSRDNAQYRSFLHWLVVNVPGNDIRSGETLANFINSQPRAGTGLHRYVFLVYEQPTWINFQGLPDYMDLIKRSRFQAEEFSRHFNLGTPMAGNLYQSKNYSLTV